MSYSPGSGNARIATSGDVALNNAVNNQLLSYNATTQKWTNRSPVASDISDLQTLIDSRIRTLTGISSGTGSASVAVSTAAGDTMLTLSWIVSGTYANLTGWSVARDGSDLGGYGAYSTVVGTDTNSFQFSNLINGTTYNLAVAPVINGVTGTATNIAAAPVGSQSTGNTPLVTATVVSGDASATINWSPKSTISGLSGWAVGRDGTNTNGSGAYATTVDPTINTFTFNLLVNGATYNLSVAPIVNGSNGLAATVVGKPVATSSGGSTGGSSGGTSGSGKFAKFTVPARGWWSGASGEGIDYNSQVFGNWRGEATDVLATWIDGSNGSAWGGGIGANTGPAAGYKGMLDIAIGGPTDYGAAAGGSMDGALTSLLQRLKAARTIGGIEYPTVIRPCHELNGNWYGHSVNSGNLANFRTTMQRWRGIANTTFPSAIWALCFNGDGGNTNVTAEQCWQDGVWDAVGSDRYNQYPYIGTNRAGGYTSWAAGSVLGTVQNPIGAERWRQFAAAHSVPLYFPEYANNGYDSGTPSNAGDDPYWVQQWFAWVKANKGTGPGKVFAEMWFNQIKEENRWILYSTNAATRQPTVANAYKAIFPV